MKHKTLAENDGARSLALILDAGEEAFEAISRFAREQNIQSASLSAIGAFEYATVGWFDLETKHYHEIPVRQQCEVLSAIGDIALDDTGKPALHIHAVLGLSDGTTRGGHFLDGLVRPTLEVTVHETPAALRRKRNAEFGISLIDI